MQLLISAVVLRENLVKMTEIPLVFRAPSLPEQLPSKTLVQLAITSIDLLDLSLQTRYVATLATAVAGDALTDEEASEIEEQATEEAAKEVAEEVAAKATDEVAGDATTAEDKAC